MFIVYILYGLLGLVELAGWGLMVYAVIREWKRNKKFKNLVVALLIAFLAIAGMCVFITSLPF